MRPKYTLTDYDGRMMIERAIAPYIGRHHVTIGVLYEHHCEFPIDQFLYNKYGNNNVTVTILKNRTAGPADTVRCIFNQTNFPDYTDSLFIKDCDSFFDHEETNGNYVCTSSITEHEILKRLASKSFVRANDQDIITDIIEKQVVSDRFCVGGYKFRSLQLFCDAFDHLNTTGVNEIFVSHVIQHCLEQGEIFLNRGVSNYIDVGTAEDWFEHNDLSVIFCDLDGTLVKAQPRAEFGNPWTPLTSNVERMLELSQQGHQIIFTTARPRDQQIDLEMRLEQMGFRGFRLITGLMNVKRVLINDYNKANPYPRAIAVNIPRDSDTLKDFL
jgi:hypothetical protein